MKKLLLQALILFTVLHPVSAAEQYDLISHYPAPYGAYSTFKLTPQSFPPTDCPVGTIYANADDDNFLWYCQKPIPENPSFYSPLGGIWSLSLDQNDLYLSDTANPLLKKVGIGTKTPAFKLTLDQDGSFMSLSTECHYDTGNTTVVGTCASLPAGAETAGTYFLFHPGKGALRAGTATDAQLWTDNNIGVFSSVFGDNNLQAGAFGSVLGGQDNQATGTSTYAAGGIFSGEDNTITNLSGAKRADLSTIVAGHGNSIEGAYGLATGQGNRIGHNNPSSNNSSTAIVTGQSNTITISGGTTTHIPITGGEGNQNTNAGILWGGKSNINGEHSILLGGADNETISFSTLLGGKNNRVQNGSASMGGGYGNLHNLSMQNTISGGCLNTILPPSDYGYVNTISGGYSNSMSEARVITISGGRNNTSHSSTWQMAGQIISGGEGNSTPGASMIPGGKNIRLTGFYSFGAGKDAVLSGSTTFLWNILTTDPIQSFTTNSAFILYGNVKMGIRTTDPQAVLEIDSNSTSEPLLALSRNSFGDKLFIKRSTDGTPFVGVGLTAPSVNDGRVMEFLNGAYVSAGGFFSNSRRESKKDISDLTLNRARRSLQQMNPVTFEYKKEPAEIHVGFVAEETPEEITGQTHNGIFALDLSAVLTKVVQDQQKRMQNNQQRLKQLQNELADLTPSQEEKP